MKNVGKKAIKGPELVGRIRGLIIDALDLLEQEGVSVQKLLADSVKDNPFKLLELASKYVPRDLHHSGEIHQTHTHIAVSEAAQRIADILGRTEDSEPPPSLPN